MEILPDPAGNKKSLAVLFTNPLGDRRGFTLAELMVVVLIIGLLAGLVLPRIISKAGKGRTAAAKAQVEILEQALDSFRLDTGRYPSTQEGLTALINNPGVDGWEGPYLKKNVIPNDPWNRPYVYACPGQHGEYDLASYGKDGTPGGKEGENAEITSWE